MKYLAIVFAFLSIGCSSSQKEGAQTEERGQVEILSPAGSNSEEPTLFATQHGAMGLTWLEKKDKVATLKFATYTNNVWSKPTTLVSGKKVLTNWADFPGIQTNGIHWVAWFLQMNNPDTFAYDVMVMQSSDEGKNWLTPQRLHSDSTLTEHGFVSAVPATNGFQLMWLDGRFATEESPIFTVRSAHLDFEGKITNRSILDDNTCTCCQTSMLNTGDDNFIAMYRNRTEEEIRDIATVNYNNTGNQEQPQIIHADEWHIPGCPVNGPRSIMNGDEIGIAWFTMGSEGVATVKFATSTDKGKTYGSPLVVNEDNKGRVDVISKDGAYYVSFMDEAETGADIKIVKIEENKIVETYLVANVSASRKTGFPRMMFDEKEEGIYVAYTDADTKQVVIKYVKL